MTQTRQLNPDPEKPEDETTQKCENHQHHHHSPILHRAGRAMRLVVPLQGVVQGRGGLILGSLIPCALYYFLQFYLKRRRSPPPPPPSSPRSPSTSSANLADLPRSSSRLSLSTRGSIGRVHVSARAGSIAKPNTSPYYIGLDRVRGDPYDPVQNPGGIIQLGLAENRVRILPRIPHLPCVCTYFKFLVIGCCEIWY